MSRRSEIQRAVQVQMSQKANAYVGALRAAPTRAEARMCDVLDDARISYVFQSCAYSVRSGVLYIPDFRIRRRSRKRDHRRLYVELDGSFHHGREGYDARRTAWLQEHKNAVVLRFTNEMVFQNPDFIIQAILPYEPILKTVYRSKTSVSRRKRGMWLAQRESLPRPTAPSVSRDMKPRLVKG